MGGAQATVMRGATAARPAGPATICKLAVLNAARQILKAPIFNETQWVGHLDMSCISFSGCSKAAAVGKILRRSATEFLC